MNKTPIQWTWAVGTDSKLIPNSGYTWNPLLGCRRISPGCGDARGGGCYAERLIGTRFSKNPKLPMYHDIARLTEKGEPRFTGNRRLLADRLDQPTRARKAGKVFVCDMGDLFFEGHPDEDIHRVLSVMERATHHIFLALTKRAARAAEILCDYFRATSPDGRTVEIPPHIWVGVSVEDQRRAEERIPHLLQVPARVRFLSVEPQLEAIEWGRFLNPGAVHPEWIIQGGESGPRARPFDLAWARSLRDQCRDAGVAYFLKQMGADPWDSTEPTPPEAAARGEEYQAPVVLNDSHGGDEAEWPADLRGCRAFPEVRP